MEDAMSASEKNGSRTHICVVLDESASMASVWDATISGFNEFLETQRAAPGEATITLVKFNTNYRAVYEGKSVKEAPGLDKNSYTPNNNTALHDAVGKALHRMKEIVPDGERALVCVITDGEENASRECSLKEIKALIEEREATGLWTFTYLGANQDAWEVGGKMGVAMGNMANYASTPAGTSQAFTSMSQGAVSLRACSSGRTDGFYGSERIPDGSEKKVTPTPRRVTKPRDEHDPGPTWKR